MMKRLLLLSVWMFSLSLEAMEPETVETQTGWGMIEVPAEVPAGSNVTVTVRVKDPDIMDAVRVDLHGRDPKGHYAGFVRWGGEPKEIPEDGVVEVTIRATPKARKELGSVHALVIPLRRNGQEFKEGEKVTSSNVKLITP